MTAENFQKIERAREVSFEFDGAEYSGFEGESIAVALYRMGKTHIRNAPNSGSPRGMFCVMGVCQECVVEIDSKKVEACRTPVSEGLVVSKALYV